jgi:hypothetical protein
MANVNANAYKTIGGGFSNEVQHVKLTYDFAEDGGATADTVRLATFGRKVVITDAVVQVETACTSGGSATVTIGLQTADADCFLTTAAGAVAALTDDACFKTTAGQAIVAPADEYVSVAIGTAALTAGKVNVFLTYRNAD